MLKGYRTYISVALAIILAGLRALNFVSEEQYQIALGVLLSLGLGFLRASK